MAQLIKGSQQIWILKVIIIVYEVSPVRLPFRLNGGFMRTVLFYPMNFLGILTPGNPTSKRLKVANIKTISGNFTFAIKVLFCILLGCDYGTSPKKSFYHRMQSPNQK